MFRKMISSLVLEMWLETRRLYLKTFSMEIHHSPLKPLHYWSSIVSINKTIVFHHHISSRYRLVRVKVFKNGPSKVCGRQLLENLKWYGLPNHETQLFHKIRSEKFAILTDIQVHYMFVLLKIWLLNVLQLGLSM